jgi:uncharacterized protein YggE
MTMRRTFVTASTFLLLGLTTLAVPASAQTPAPTMSTVVTAGESVLKVAPDQAWVMVSVETRDTKGPEARRLGAVAMTSVMAALKKTGLPTDAIQTTGFALHPEYDYTNGKQRMKGFIVSNQLQVRIDDVNAVADVLDAVAGLALPASSTATIGGLRFDLKDRAGLERKALTQAVQDATERAKAMAQGAGMTVGRIVRIEEGGAQPMMKFESQPMMMSARAGDAVSTPIAPSDIEVRARVALTVEIK